MAQIDLVFSGIVNGHPSFQLDNTLQGRWCEAHLFDNFDHFLQQYNITVYFKWDDSRGVVNNLNNHMYKIVNMDLEVSKIEFDQNGTGFECFTFILDNPESLSKFHNASVQSRMVI